MPFPACTDESGGPNLNTPRPIMRVGYGNDQISNWIKFPRNMSLWKLEMEFLSVSSGLYLSASVGEFSSWISSWVWSSASPSSCTAVHRISFEKLSFLFIAGAKTTSELRGAISTTMQLVSSLNPRALIASCHPTKILPFKLTTQKHVYCSHSQRRSKVYGEIDVQVARTLKKSINLSVAMKSQERVLDLPNRMLY